MTSDTLTESNIRSHIHALAGSIGERNIYRPDALNAAAAYIEQQWREQDYEVMSQSYDAKGVVSRNLEVTHPGTTRPDEILLLGAHYDTVRGSPGANDNTSGIAALLEISRALTGMVTERTIRLVAFVNEEAPFFFWRQMGSMVYANAARQRGDDIRLMMSLETMGHYSDQPHSQRYPPLFRYFFPDTANFIAFVANFRSRRAMCQTVDAFKSHSDFPVEQVATFSFIPGVAWSDHLSFWRQGYPALMVTDTAFYRYRYYHTGQDTPDKINYPALARVTTGLALTVAALANSRSH